MKKPPKPCETCNDTAIPGQRFCKECRKAVLDELNSAGYLETGGFGRKGQGRTAEMKEVTYETKYGTGH